MKVDIENSQVTFILEAITRISRINTNYTFNCLLSAFGKHATMHKLKGLGCRGYLPQWSIILTMYFSEEDKKMSPK